VAEALASAHPEHEASIRAEFAKLEGSLLTLDARFAAAADAIGDEPLIFSHPVYQYLERRYGLNGRSLHWEPDEPPRLDDLEPLEKELRARWIIWEAAPIADGVRELEARGYTSVVFDPCGRAPKSGDLMSVMEANAEALELISQASTARNAK
jgi:zinc transport system substrate-binding protein